MKRIIFPSIAALILAGLSTYFLYKWTMNAELDPNIKFEVDSGQIVKLFLIFLVYFFALIVMPVFAKDIVNRTLLEFQNWWKVLLAFEFGVLLFSAICSPPDAISIITVFIFCQLIVVVNVFVFYKILNSKK